MLISNIVDLGALHLVERDLLDEIDEIDRKIFHGFLESACLEKDAAQKKLEAVRMRQNELNAPAKKRIAIQQGGL